MLDELAVRNVAVLEEARIQPGPHLTVITGETGTGKTLLVGALGILGGDDFRADRIGPFGTEASVEARFVSGDEEFIVARRLERGGRTRSSLDGHMASATELRDRIGASVEIVAQNDHLRLARGGEVLHLLDGLLDEAGRTTLAEYRGLWHELTEIERRATTLGGDRRALQREADLLAHESAEIEAAGFTEDEVTDLRENLSRLRHAQDLLGLIGKARIDLDLAAEALGRAVAATRRAADLTDALRPLAERVNGLSIEVRDALSEAGDELERTSVDPAFLERTEERLALLGELRRRYGDTVAEITEYGRRAAARSQELTETLSVADRIDSERDRLLGALAACGARLTVQRKACAETVAERTKGHLLDLGFSTPHVAFTFSQDGDPGPAGTAGAALAFASDEALTPGPVSRIASGGELSRLVLALRLATGMEGVDVVAFDEIDAGIGGTTALRLGEKLAELASRHQVLCVTHLPQIAAFADTHYTVERLDGAARVRRLEGAARLTELTRMLSGIETTESGLTHAEELIAYADKRRP